VTGREEIIAFLQKKWEKELHYKLKKEYWAHTGNRIAVRFEYEYQTKEGTGSGLMEMKTGNSMKTG
jgi:nuclear transport factor 2 (NTF2) superfamily protein